MTDLLERVLKADRVAISKVITMLEDELPGSQDIYRRLLAKAGRSYVIGIAGPPGAGKSTLINCLTKEFRRRNMKVAVVAVDPSSSLTGGAILGDRVRMLEHSLDDGVFIRSMASRGSLGGIAKSTRKVVNVLDAAGFDFVFVETVGVGQTELDIARIADITIVVLMPQSGDEVQAMKAGLIEIGDIFVVNKADLEGADKAVIQLLPFIKEKGDWRPPVIRTVAKTCQGVAELTDSILKFREKQNSRADLRVINELKQAISEKMQSMMSDMLSDEKGLQEFVEKVRKRKLDVDEAASEFIRKALNKFEV